MAAAAGKPIQAYLVCPAALPVKPLLPTPSQPRAARQLQPAVLPVVLQALLATQRIWARSLTSPMPKPPKRLPISRPLLPVPIKMSPRRMLPRLPLRLLRNLQQRRLNPL